MKTAAPVHEIATKSQYQAKAQPVIQPKLMVNAPGDRYEQEADAMANRVMGMQSSRNTNFSSTGMIGKSIQREGRESEGNKEEKQGTIMRKAESRVGFYSSQNTASQLNANAGGGFALQPATRSFMESGFQTDFSGVRIHNDAKATSLNHDLDAKAFTYGNDIYFNSGQYQPETDDGKRLLAHELTHTVQQKNINHSAFSHSSLCIAKTDDDPDHPTAATDTASDSDDVKLEPLAELTFSLDIFDPSLLIVPAGTMRVQIAERLYNDPNHYGGFDFVGATTIRLRSFDGVAEDVIATMRSELDSRQIQDVNEVVGVLCHRIIDDSDEWHLLSLTIFWNQFADLTNNLNVSYFDAFLEALDSNRLTEEGLFTDTTKTAYEWLIIEAEEKQSDLFALLKHTNSLNLTNRIVDGNGLKGYARIPGPITDQPNQWHPVGGYSYHIGENRFLISKEVHATDAITVNKLIVDESSASKAEIALRNFPQAVPRIMIPGENGHFYGYMINSPSFWNEDYVQPGPSDDATLNLEKFWWTYPGVVFIPAGSFDPDFAIGGQEESAQRDEILTKAIAGGIESLRGLDFYTLSLMTLDQRMAAINLAIMKRTASDASLIARIFYSTPSADFLKLEHQFSTTGLLNKLSQTSTIGNLSIIGPAFTAKALESTQVPGETLTDLPEFKVGYDDDGYYHYANAIAKDPIPSQLLPAENFSHGEDVTIGHERSAPGEQSGSIMRDAIYIQPAVFKGGGFFGNLWRGMEKELLVNEGALQGPYLPTQLVRITKLGKTPETSIVTALEALGILEMPVNSIFQQLLSTHIRGGLYLLAGMGVARAFGPAILEGLSAGSARAVGTSLIQTAATQAGRSALVNAALITGMNLVDSHRSELEASEEGRDFLEIYDVASLIWISHDVVRLFQTGLLPRLVTAADKLIALPGALRDALLPIRAEAEAFSRTISRYGSPAEATEAALADGATGAGVPAAGSGNRPGFFSMLRVSRGEVASENLLTSIAGTPSQGAGKRVFDRLESLITRSERDASQATAESAEAASATRRANSAASARLALAQRALQLQPAAREAFIATLDAIVAARPNSLASLTDLFTAAAQSRYPNVFLTEVQTLIGRNISDETVLMLGRKIRAGRDVLDLAWLNKTSLTDETLDFLGKDKRTPWDLYKRAGADPSILRTLRPALRGASAEIVAESSAKDIGTNVKRQVPMGSSELDYEITVGRKRYGFEIKGWTKDTWKEALDAAIKRLSRRGLSAGEKDAVRKIDAMLSQLQDAKAATGNSPYLGLTKNLPEAEIDKLKRILRDNKLGGTQLKYLDEKAIKDTAAQLGKDLGIL